MKELLEIVDEKKTVLAAKKVLRDYRKKMLMVARDYTPRITSSFTIDTSISTSVEKAVIKKVDSENEYNAFFDYLNRGLKKLSTNQRQIIAMSFLEMEPYTSYQIAGDLKVAERTFYRMKNLALIKLAIALNVAVYREEEEMANEENCM